MTKPTSLSIYTTVLNVRNTMIGHLFKYMHKSLSWSFPKKLQRDRHAKLYYRLARETSLDAVFIGLLAIAIYRSSANHSQV